jgi:hypothetical protein
MHHRPLLEAERNELPQGDDAVLPFGERGNLYIDWSILGTHEVPKVDQPEFRPPPDRLVHLEDA